MRLWFARSGFPFSGRPESTEGVASNLYQEAELEFTMVKAYFKS